MLEGAGGITVELKEGYSFAGFAQDLSYPVLIVVPKHLGVLNHLKLTLHFLRTERLFLFGVILNDHIQAPFTAREMNEEEVRKISGNAYLGRIPFGAISLPEILFANFRQRLRESEG